MRVSILMLLGMLLVPVTSAQEAPVRSIPINPGTTRPLPALSIPSVDTAVLRRVREDPSKGNPATNAIAPPLTDAMRVAILTEGTALENTSAPPPVVTDLSLSVREPYQPEGWLTFNQAGHVDTRYRFARMTSEGVLVLRMEVVEGQRYLLDYTVSMGDRATLRLYGAGVNKTETLGTGSNHLLTIIEAPFTGQIRLALSVSGTGNFDFHQVDVSRLAR